jgi:Bacterial transglutaminase-like cysteine proteinase BTLCP
MTHPEQLIQWLRSACLSVAHGLGAADSPWERVPMDVPATAFGPGSRWQFAHYFEGESRVRVTSIDDIVEWLGTCEYVSDTDQFHEQDLWQQPCAFERLRRGDCEDFALWAWRKLAEIGVESEFYVGRVVCGDEPPIDRHHAWVVYRVDRADFLFEPAARDRQRMIQPLSAVKDEYVPHFAVDRRFVTCAFVGCILDLHREAAPA